MTTYTIKNQLGNYIYKESHVSAILSMVHNNIDKIEIEGRSITLLKRFKTEDVCNIVVEVEGIE